MTSQYTSVPLGEILNVIQRPEPVEPNREYQLLGARWYAKGLYTKDTKSGSRIQAKTLYRVKEGDFVYNRLFAWKGSFALATRENDGCYVSNEFPCFALRQDRVFPGYLQWYFSRSDAWNEALGLSTGGTPTSRNRLKEQKFLAMEIALPPLDEQRRIVARIEELAAKIEEARRLRVQAMIGSRAMWASAGQTVLDSLGDAPRQKLGSVVSVLGGGTPSKSNPMFWNGSIPWVSPKDMKSRDIYDAADHITDEAIANSAAKAITPDAVLIVVRGMILAHTVPVAVLRVPAAINQDMKALVPNPGLLPEYLSTVLWALNSRLVDLVARSTHDTRKLETAVLLDFEIPIPDLDEQRKIVEFMNSLAKKSDTVASIQHESNTVLDALIPAVLDQAFSGDL